MSDLCILFPKLAHFRHFLWLNCTILPFLTPKLKNFVYFLQLMPLFQISCKIITRNLKWASCFFDFFFYAFGRLTALNWPSPPSSHNHHILILDNINYPSTIHTRSLHWSCEADRTLLDILVIFFEQKIATQSNNMQWSVVGWNNTDPKL